ncbi:MAG: hypothetical protein H0X30_23805 [Anaerolineae bacterium]|nr:hypothetical protein [Anaerolineae bacterium]
MQQTHKWIFMSEMSSSLAIVKGSSLCLSQERALKRTGWKMYWRQWRRRRQ